MEYSTVFNLEGDKRNETPTQMWNEPLEERLTITIEQGWGRGCLIEWCFQYWEHMWFLSLGFCFPWKMNKSVICRR